MDREVPIPFGKKLSGIYTPPPSKSHTIRALLIASLAKGESVIHSPSDCEDAKYLKEAIKKWRAVEYRGDSFIIKESRSIAPPPGKYFIGGSATAMRFLLALFSRLEGERIIDGDETLRKRPVGAGIGIAEDMGAEITGLGSAGCLPQRIKGKKWRSDKIKVSDKISSQFVSGMLIAAPLNGSEVAIEMDDPVSFPYIEMTMKVMTSFGVKVDLGGSNIAVSPGKYKGSRIEIEKDYSNAAFFLAAAAATGSEITVEGLKKQSIQGDSEVLKFLEDVGIELAWTNSFLNAKGFPKSGFNIDLSNHPDLFPPLAVLALMCSDVSVFRGTNRLDTKESSRGRAIAEAIGQVGGKAFIGGDFIKIEPQIHYKGTVLDPQGDHRLAMAFAVTGLLAEGTSVLNPECAEKSYPQFWRDFFNLLS
jgi:3-phosphoshikimate 1-carboxyvinyltransferase